MLKANPWATQLLEQDPPVRRTALLNEDPETEELLPALFLYEFADGFQLEEFLHTVIVGDEPVRCLALRIPDGETVLETLWTEALLAAGAGAE